MARRRGVLATIVQVQREAERDRQRRARVAAQSQLAAQRAHARAAVQDQKLRDRLYGEDRMREAAEETARVEQQVETLLGVLAATLGVDDYLDLEALKAPPVHPAFEPSSVGPAPVPPNEADFAVEGPAGLGRVFGASKHAARAEQRQQQYQSALNAYQSAAHQHQQRVEQARSGHASQLARLAEQHQRYVEAVNSLQHGLVARQPEAVVRYLDLVLEAAEYPDGFPHSWQLAYTSTSGHLTIDYELPRVSVVPTDKAFKYVKSSDTITASTRPATQVRTIYADVLRQTALRVVHEVLEADRAGLVRTVVFNGHVTETNPATGREMRPCLVALATSRERFSDIDLARVDPSACLDHLEALVSKDPTKLQGVEPIVLAGSLQADFTLYTDVESDPLTSPSPSLSEPALPVGGLSSPQTIGTQELFAGQNVPLAGTQFQIDLQATRADLSLLLLGDDGRVGRDEDFVFYNNPRSAQGAVSLAGREATINTAVLSAHHVRIAVVVSSDGGDPIADATTVLRQSDGMDELLFRPAGASEVSALVWGELYQRSGGWRLRAVGQGWSDGLAGLARDYGVDVS